MLSRRLQTLRTIMMAIACIAVAGAPAWATTSSNCNYSCCCQGVDCNGCLTNSGCCNTTCCCVCNTKTCLWKGCCSCEVKNCCKKYECWSNCCWYLKCCSWCCTYNYYCCESTGCCNYICTGSLPA
jgi:hypothetical protein